MSILGRIAQGFRDWSQLPKIKKELLAELRRTPPGRIMRINTAGDPQYAAKAHLVERAVIELIREHPDKIEVLDGDTGFALMRKIDAFKIFEQGAQAQHAEMVRRCDILTVDNLGKLGAFDDCRLPERRFRNGLPADFNGTPEGVERALNESARDRGIRLLNETPGERAAREDRERAALEQIRAIEATPPHAV